MKLINRLMDVKVLCKGNKELKQMVTDIYEDTWRFKEEVKEIIREQIGFNIMDQELKQEKVQAVSPIH